MTILESVRAVNEWMADVVWPRGQAGALTPPDPPFARGGNRARLAPPLSPPCEGGAGGVLSRRCNGSDNRSSPAGREAIVAARFDALHARFKPDVAEDDPRAQALLESLGPLHGRRILDLGCGKGRFARILADRGARVVGLDVSAAMLAAAGGAGLDRVRGSARRLPFRDASFDAAIAVEVFEHLEPRAIDDVCDELRRVLRPGGRFVLVDKNVYAMNARRPWLPALAVKWLDQRRGLWMYPAGGPVRERWFRPAGMRRRLARWFPEVRMRHLLSRDEAGRFPFRSVPATRLFVLWAARSPGGSA
jgi:SAM-dependent methyltransferase